MFKGFFNKKDNKGNVNEPEIKNNNINKTKSDNKLNLKPRVEYKKSLNSSLTQATFEGVMLLKGRDFNFETFKNDLSNVWLIKLDEKSEEDGTRVFEVDSLRVTYKFVGDKVPNQGAEIAAARNFMWSESLIKTREHSSHVVITVSGNANAKQKGILFTKIMEIGCEQESVLGLYTNGTVYNPETYRGYASVMDAENSGPLPILNLVWMGFTKSDHGYNMYTNGLNNFDKEEIEIVNSTLGPNILFNTMLEIVSYVLENNTTLQDGELLILAEHKKWKFRRSKAVAFDGMSLKVEWKK